MSNWEKVSQEVIKKGQKLVGLKKGELQIQLAKALVRIEKAQDFIRNETSLNDSEIDELAMILDGDYDE